MTDLARTLETLEAAVHRKRYGGGILFFEPYVKQKRFLDLGAKYRERLLIAGNQLGKSIDGDVRVGLSSDRIVSALVGRQAV